MIDEIITTDNWNTTYYGNGEYKASIGFELNPDFPERDIYTVNIVDNENIDVFHKSFPTADAACQFINLRYHSIWDFNNLAVPQSTGGCGSCVAH